MKKLFIFSVLLVVYGKAYALPELLQADWLVNKDQSVVILDIQEPAQYQRFHIPGAINAPFSGWRQLSSEGVNGVVLPVKTLVKKLGDLGISAKDHVVVVATGISAGDISAAARVFWTFKYLGHDAVSVLDGGLVAYANLPGAQLQKTSIQVENKTLYQTNVLPSLLAEKADVQAALGKKGVLVDARSYAEYQGVLDGGGDERPGTLAAAVNMPFDWLLKPGTGQLRDSKQLSALYQQLGVSDKGAIYFCHTGNRAALNWFVDYAVLGNKKARLYDASMAEWAVNPQLPLQLNIDLGN